MDPLPDSRVIRLDSFEQEPDINQCPSAGVSGELVLQDENGRPRRVGRHTGKAGSARALSLSEIRRVDERRRSEVRVHCRLTNGEGDSSRRYETHNMREMPI